MRNEAVRVWGPGDQTFGHSGWGGSCAFADPETRIGAALPAPAMERRRPSTADLAPYAQGARLDEALSAANRASASGRLEA